jgi:hypothetical protein
VRIPFGNNGFLKVRVLGLPLLMWDEYGPRHFTLSYIRLQCSPDVFPDEFVIIYSWADGFRGEGK